METRRGLGAELREIRMIARLSMVEAARRADVSRMTLHRWETEASVPEIAGLDRLLKALGADERTRARMLSDAAPTPALPELSNGPLGSPVHIGQALRAMRVRAGLGQGEVALRVGGRRARSRGGGQARSVRPTTRWIGSSRRSGLQSRT